ncbi:MAG: SOS response-associated peptidase [Opitutaceae bacterium]|nr:SOS response-associated peptidase [Cytophagales bacterium]
MCGRYTLKSTKAEIEKRFKSYADPGMQFEPNYNACPSSLLPIVTNKKTQTIINAKWGLVPAWSLNLASQASFVNATLEGILTTKSFKGPIENQRCIVIADGYYEWKTIGKIKIPYYVQINNGELFAFAGIYETNEDTNVLSFSLITMEPNSKLSFIHHRMPAILSPEQESLWLDSDINGKEAIEIITQYSESMLNFYTVSNRINKPGFNDENLIIPYKHENVATQGDLF